jgi:hypothetical protein
MPPESPALAAYFARDDLTQYAPNGLLLFALQLRLGIEDIHSIAATSLTDGPNDKKCDLVYVDRGTSRIIVAQSYVSLTGNQSEAPANKASDLNTAVTWLIAGDLTLVPENLRSAAEEVRDALSAADIRDFAIWYVHNLSESPNVQRELNQAATTADSLIKRHFPHCTVNCSGVEIGLSQLQESYRRTEASIAVNESFTIPIQGGFEVASDQWKAFVTSIPATWLRDIWQQHAEDLMSPNVRDYLGIVKSERNINNGIQTTAAQGPGQFWIYNNGLTILVHAYTVTDRREDGTAELHIEGIGIVNGAQTTGSIGTLSDPNAQRLDCAFVLTRFVTCNDPDILADIVKFNNTQNKVEAADFRSKDAVQDRLRAEFEAISDADYRGARRGGVRAAIERSRNLLPDSAVAQSLAAFHLEPNLAYNDTRRIWVDDGTYSDYFAERTTARHIVFTFSGLRAVEASKKRVTDIDEGTRTEAQQRHVAFFRRRGSTLLMVAAISASIEAFLGRPVQDRWKLRFLDNCSPAEAQARWQPIVDAALAFSNQLLNATDLGLKNPDTVNRALESFQALVEATSEINRSRYDVFAASVMQ